MTAVNDNTATQQIELLMAQANEARRDYEAAAHLYRTYAHTESMLEAERPGVLENVKAHLMTSSAGLAATNAEKLARSHPEYLDHLEKQRDATLEKDDARTRMVSAALQAKTAIAVIKALAGLI